ncbi:MAG TPA: enoyl-CoA hydratase-related protein [Actinomycetota bacterium]|nr:enoyl-CoA hydratase-related protein [Actinomycetota bacterium]
MGVELTIDGHRADLELNRPEVLNAWNWDVFEGLAKATTELAHRDDVRVVVVSGRGRSFSSGIDTTMFAAGELPAAELIAKAQEGIRNLVALPVPTIAKVRGHAYGAGLQLALACDLCVITTDAKVGLLEAKYGLIPDLGGAHRLAALAGPAVAKHMMWLAEKIDGVEAHRRGLAQTLVEPEGLDAAVDELAERIAAAPPMVVRGIKKLVDSAARSTFVQSMDDVAAAQEEVMASRDFGEAIGAFLQKRPPEYTGG